MTTVIEGKAGRAERAENVMPVLTAQTATLVSWLIYAPDQSPAWSHYLLSVIHLRPIEGARPATVRIAGATHELLLVALDPKYSPVVTDIETWHHLVPANAEAQFRVDTDEQAIRLAEMAVRAIVNGFMPAEPAFQDSGRQQWQDAVTSTAEHMRTGGHSHAT